MRLKNKKTGEIVEVESLDVDTPTEGIVGIPSFDRKGSYSSLAELNEEWEDVPEEPKTHWMIDTSVLEPVREIAGNPYEIDKEIGNWFSTKEEAEKAVEKLKCFTNLKNHEFMFDGWYYGTDGNIVILANAYEFNDMEEQDLTKVFGEKIC